VRGGRFLIIAQVMITPPCPAGRCFLLPVCAGIFIRLEELMHIKTLRDSVTLAALRLRNDVGELDEKALLIALFVIAAIVGLSPLGSAIAKKFQQMATSIG